MILSTIRRCYGLAISALLCLTATSCRDTKPKAEANNAASLVQSSVASSTRIGALARLSEAELRRNPAAITDADLSHRDVSVRFHAARALARSGQRKTLPLLLRALHDGDSQVVGWAAYGLGIQCGGRASQVVPQLVARAASLAGQGGAVAGDRAKSVDGAIDPWFAISDALARCGGSEAERVLRSWLQPESPAPTLSALALGRMASRVRRLEDATLVALLDAASRTPQPLLEALYPFGRLAVLEESISLRVFDVATSVLRSGDSEKAYAIGALTKVGARAAPVLREAAEMSSLAPSLRAAAVRGLTGLGEPGQMALRELLANVQLGKSSESWTSAEWAVFAGVLDGLEPPVGAAASALEALSELAIPADDSMLRSRVVRARCYAGALLAGGVPESKRLASCDPIKDGREGQIAVLRVLDHSKIRGVRFERWQKLAMAPDPWVRQRALRLLIKHPEIPQAARIVAESLRSGQLGVVAVAAEVLAAVPQRAGSDTSERAALRPDSKVVDALAIALDAEWPPDAVETVGALAQAAGALQLLNFKPRLERLCTNAVVGLKERIRRALKLLGEREPACQLEPPTGATAPPVWGQRDEVRIEFDTSAGPLSMILDAKLAPAAVRRVADLVDQGFYSGVSIHRAIPGFVVQFGDPGGDGYGGAGLLPLPCESSPLPFQMGSVGMALSGKDTGSSQIFITFGSFPHLDGDYPLIGQAGPGWDRLALGDTIVGARVIR